MANSIDDKIKRDLQAQTQELETLVDGGLLDYMKAGFASSYSWMTKLGYVIAIVFSGLILYCGYQFFTVSAGEQLFWGVLLILSFIAQVATKLWIFMQTNRNILSRELRLMELRLTQGGFIQSNSTESASQ